MKAIDSMFLGLSRLLGTQVLERQVAVEYFKCSFLILWALQMKLNPIHLPHTAVESKVNKPQTIRILLLRLSEKICFCILGSSTL